MNSTYHEYDVGIYFGSLMDFICVNAFDLVIDEMLTRPESIMPS